MREPRGDAKRNFPRGKANASETGSGRLDVDPLRSNEYSVSMILERYPDILRLSPEEKLALVTELWDDLASNPSDIPVTPEEIAELDRRMEEYRKDPTQVTNRRSDFWAVHPLRPK